MTKNGLNTKGGEFLLPNGKFYVGKYHVHHKKGAMVGERHVDKKHDSLTPATSAAAQKVADIMNTFSRKGARPTSTSTRRRRRTTPSAPRSAYTPRTSPSNSPQRSSTRRSSEGGGGGY
jgi:hypothetical protein